MNHYVAPKKEIIENSPYTVEFGGEEIVIFHIEGELFAIRNLCPHRGGPLSQGKITNSLECEWPSVGERVCEQLSGDPAIACPWHGWEFDLKSGTHLGDDDFGIKTYGLLIDDDEVFIDM